MKIFVKVFLAIFFLSFFITSVQSQPNGEQLFKVNCAVCHKIDTRLVGPALKGVNERREEEWLLKFVKSSQTVIKSGDETAVQLFNEFNKLVMPDQPTFSDDDVLAILEYIASFDKEQEVIEVDSNKINYLANLPKNFFDEEVKEARKETGMPLSIMLDTKSICFSGDFSKPPLSYRYFLFFSLHWVDEAKSTPKATSLPKVNPKFSQATADSSRAFSFCFS